MYTKKYYFLLLGLLSPLMLPAKVIHYTKSIKFASGCDYINTYVAQESRVYRRHNGLEPAGKFKDMALFNNLMGTGVKDWSSCREINKALYHIDQCAADRHTPNPVGHLYKQKIEHAVKNIMEEVDRLYRRNTFAKAPGEEQFQNGLRKEKEHFEKAIQAIMHKHNMTISFEKTENNGYHVSIVKNK